MPRSYNEILAAAGKGMWNLDGTYTPALTDEDYRVIIDRYLDDPSEVMSPGYTNDEMVNLAIACGSLGEDFCDVFRQGLEHIPASDHYRVIDHFERIEPYVGRWCNSGCAEIYMVR